MTTTIPCRRPKVTVDPHPAKPDSSMATCRVPGCTWTYPGNVGNTAVKSDAEEHALCHRGEHRAAVPATKVVHDVEWDVYCTPCGGHRRTFGTKTDADAWLAYHLSTEHRLVTC